MMNDAGHRSWLRPLRFSLRLPFVLLTNYDQIFLMSIFTGIKYSIPIARCADSWREFSNAFFDG